MYVTPSLDITPNADGFKATGAKSLLDEMDYVSIAVIWMELDAEICFYPCHPKNLTTNPARSTDFAGARKEAGGKSSATYCWCCFWITYGPSVTYWSQISG